MQQSDHDEDLLARAGGGDRGAFTTLVGRYEARMMAVALRLCPDRANAEDAFQDALIKAWVHAPRWTNRLSGRNSAAAWLARIALNCAIDLRRRARPAEASEGVDLVPDGRPTAEQALLYGERARRLQHAIAGLPERQRLAITLTYDVGLSNALGAEVLGASVGAFELLLVRARRTLRAVLEEDQAHDSR